MTDKKQNRKRKTQRITALFCALFTLVTALLPASAAEGQTDTFQSPAGTGYTRTVDVIPDFSAEYLAGRGVTLDEASSSDGSKWIPASEGLNVTGAASPNSYPYTTPDGNGCIYAQCTQAANSEWYYISRSYRGKGLDLSDCGSVVIPLLCDYVDASSTFNISINIYASDGSKKIFRAQGLGSETWNGVICNISSWESRTKITQIKIGVRCTSKEEQSHTFTLGFCVDSVYGCYTDALERAVMLSSELYSVSGAYNTLAFLDDERIMRINAAEDISEELYIASGKIPASVYENAEAVRVRFRVCPDSELDTLQLEYTTSSKPSFRQNTPIILSVEQTNDTQVCYFPLPEGSITQIKLTLNAEAHGQFEFYSITPASYYSVLAQNEGGSTAVTDRGRLNSCRISSEKSDRIVIRGSLDRETVGTYRGQAVALYELFPWQPNSAVFSDDIRPLKSTSVSESITFEIPLYEGGRSRLTSRFVAVLYDQSNARPLILGSPVYITNPEILASDTVKHGNTTSRRGLTSDSRTISETGSTHTTLDVDLGRMIADFRTNTAENREEAADSSYIIYEYGERFCCFDGDYIEELDREINDILVSGAALYLHLQLTMPVYPAMRGLLIPAQSDSSSASRYGFDVSGESQAELLGASVAFLGERYFSPGNYHADHNIENTYTASGIIFGSELDYACRYYNMGALRLREYADSYTRALRIAYNTLRSICSDAKVIIPLGNDWDFTDWDKAALRYSSRDLLDCISAQLRAEGQIPCALSFDPYPERSKPVSTLETEDGAVKLLPLDGNDITLTALPELCRYLRQSRLLCDGNPRTVLLIHDTDPIYSITESVTTAEALDEYILALEMISGDAYSNIECFIFDGSFIRGSESEREKLCSSLLMLDCAEGEKLIAEALEARGITERTQNTTGAKKHSGAEGKISYSPKNIKGSSLLWDTESPVRVNTESPAPQYLISYGGSAKNTESGYFGSIPAREYLFEGSRNDGVYAVITEVFPYPRDLSRAPIISFGLCCADTSDRSGSAEITVEFHTQNGRIRYSGSAALGTQQQPVCNLSRYESASPGITSVEAMTIYISAPDSDSLKVICSSPTASSTSLTDDEIRQIFRAESARNTASEQRRGISAFVNVIVVIFISATALEAIYIALRIRAAKKSRAKLEEEERLRFRQKLGF